MTVVRAEGGTALVRGGTKELCAVLLAAGFDAIEVTAGVANDVRDAVEHAGDGSRGIATLALRSVARDGAIDVWIADAVTKKTTVRRITSGARSTPARSREIALRALDLLRASLLELDAPPPRKRRHG